MPSSASVGDAPSTTTASTPITSMAPTLTLLRCTFQAFAVPLAVPTTICLPSTR